jgi:hypothetical protein
LNARPLVAEKRTVAKMCVGDVSKKEIALNELYAIETNAMANAVPPIGKRREQMECYK